jgi:hypothetical protein
VCNCKRVIKSTTFWKIGPGAAGKWTFSRRCRKGRKLDEPNPQTSTKLKGKRIKAKSTQSQMSLLLEWPDEFVKNIAQSVAQYIFVKINA